MKTAIYFIFTCFISTGAFYGALYAKHPFPLYAIGFGIVALFIWGCGRRHKKRIEKNDRERMFLDYTRTQNRKSGY